MSRMRQGYLLRGVAILIAAVFSGAWTFSVAGIGGLSSVSADDGIDVAPDSLPDGSSVPSQAVDTPASFSDPADLTNGNTASVIAASSTNSIPAAALAAYQRAETVINKADESCNITWQLIAAIGRVESNHGRVHGNVLDSEGMAKPGIYGPALNGTAGVKAISDTDAGQYDSDAKWDRAVGPMQFIPSTWSVVGVDADGDGLRNPQDIDDAALATAVYLCSGEDNLSTLAGQKSAIFRYNNSTRYVDLVLKIMEQYLSGDYTSIVGTTTAGGYIVPDPTYNPPPAYNPPKGNKSRGGGSSSTSSSSTTGGATTTTPPSGDTPDETPDDDNNTDDGPLAGGDGGGGGGGVTTNDGPLAPEKDNVPNTGNGTVDEPVEQLVDGLAGALKPIEIALACKTYALTHALNPDAEQECLNSYK